MHTQGKHAERQKARRKLLSEQGTQRSSNAGIMLGALLRESYTAKHVNQEVDIIIRHHTVTGMNVDLPLWGR